MVQEQQDRDKAQQSRCLKQSSILNSSSGTSSKTFKKLIDCFSAERLCWCICNIKIHFLAFQNQFELVWYWRKVYLIINTWPLICAEFSLTEILLHKNATSKAFLVDVDCSSIDLAGFQNCTILLELPLSTLLTPSERISKKNKKNK